VFVERLHNRGFQGGILRTWGAAMLRPYKAVADEWHWIEITAAMT